VAGGALLVAAVVPAGAARAAGAERVQASGTFVPAAQGGDALTYRADLVPVGSQARVQAVYPASGSSIVTLHVRGFVPNREYGAHAHVAPCGTSPLASGGHFQHVQGGATDPAYANPRNEIWLDFTTDDEGNASAQTRVPWQFDTSRAKSVVIHIEHTHTGPTDSGVAGARLACINVPF
jgi:Cu-Zn family superoxide dismutase